MGIGSFLLVYVCLNNRFSRYTIITGKLHYLVLRITLVEELPSLFIFFINKRNCILYGSYGVVAQVIQEWSRPITHDGEGFNMIVVAGVICILLYYIFWQGKQALFEKILSLFVLLWEFVFLLPCLL